MKAVPAPSRPWPRRLELVWTVPVAALLVGAVVEESWFWVLLAGLALVGGLLELRRRSRSSRQCAELTHA